MSILGGFANRVATDIGDKRQYIRARVEEDRMYLRQQGLQRQSAITEQRDNLQRATEQLLRTQGVDRNTVLAALEADPDAILDMVGRDITNGADINTVFEVYRDTENSGNLTEILDRVMPAVANLPADADPTTRRRAGIAGWLGLDMETELNEQVYSAQIVGGMTGDQILASMNIPVRPRGVGTAGQLNYSAIDPSEKLSSTERNYWYSEVIPEYDDMLEERIQELRAEEAGASIEEKSAFMEQIKELEELQTGPDGVRLPKLMELFDVTDLARGYFGTYGNRLFSPEFGFNPLLMEKFKPTDNLEETGGDRESSDTVNSQENVDGSVRPNMRPDIVLSPDDVDGTAIRKFFEMYPDRDWVYVMKDGETVRVEREETKSERRSSGRTGSGIFTKPEGDRDRIEQRQRGADNPERGSGSSNPVNRRPRG